MGISYRRKQKLPDGTYRELPPWRSSTTRADVPSRTHAPRRREYIIDRQTERTPNGTINRELAVLKRTFSLAVKDKKLHVKPQIPMLAENNVRRGFFEQAQFEVVLGHNLGHNDREDGLDGESRKQLSH